MNNQILQETIREWHSKTPDSVHGVGWGYKTTNGITTDELCVVFAVVSKKPLAELTQEEILPTSLIIDNETVKTDVVESELAQALSNCHGSMDSSSSDHRVSHRPLVGGISVGRSETVHAGTLGGIFRDKEDGSVVGLTNLHVVCSNVPTHGTWSAERNSSSPLWDIESKSMTQPGNADAAGVSIGNTKRYYPFSVIDPAANYIDAAVIGLDSSSLIGPNSGSQLGPTTPVNYGVATTAEIDDLLVHGNFLVKSGRTTGYIGSNIACRMNVVLTALSVAIDYRGTILVVNDTLGISYVDGGVNVNVPGDSGSILLANFSGTLKIVGLIFAGGIRNTGDPANSFGIACRIDRVMESLNLEPVGTTTLINAASNWSFISRAPRPGHDPNIIENGKTYWECGKLANGFTKYVTYSQSSNPPTPSPLIDCGPIRHPWFNMNMVTVGDPENLADSTGYGAVSESYQIGKYCVTGYQYAAFLNAVCKSDTHNLYNTNMGIDLYGQGVAQISRSAPYNNPRWSTSLYDYDIINDSGFRPITYHRKWYI